MVNLPLILAAGSLFTLISGAPVPSDHSSVHRHTERHAHHAPSLSKRTYNVLGGNGKTSDGWPSHENWWPSFDKMFEANRDTMKQSCNQWNVPNNSDQEIDDIYSSIKEVASSSGVDSRFVLAIVIQETNGCVRAPTSQYYHSNPGLMQSHEGQASCNSDSVQNPCPKAQIKQMIEEGTAGTPQGDGLKQCLAKQGSTDSAAFYAAARCYNSGSPDNSGNLGKGVATHCYCSDVANRLTGWSSGPSSCNENSIGNLNKAVSSIFRFSGSLLGGDSGSGSGSGSDDTTQSQTSSTDTTPEPTTTQAPPASVEEPATTEAPSATITSTATQTSTSTSTSTSTYTLVDASSTPTPEPAATEEPTATSAAPSSGSAPIYPNANSSCKEYYTVEDGDYCVKIEPQLGITVDQLRELNSGLKEDCTNLWLGYQYCIKA